MTDRVTRIQWAASRSTSSSRSTVSSRIHARGDVARTGHRERDHDDDRRQGAARDLGADAGEVIAIEVALTATDGKLETTGGGAGGRTAPTMTVMAQPWTLCPQKPGSPISPMSRTPASRPSWR